MRANFVRSAAVAAVLTAVSGTAFAADVVYQEPPAPMAPIISTPVASWAGGYGGMSFGYGFGHTRTNAPAGDIDTNGFLLNGFVGWQGQSNQFVYGIEGDIGYNFMHDKNSIAGSQLGFEGALRARLGYAVSDATLLYVAAGGSVGNHRFIDTGGFGADRQTLWGWNIGAGVDQKLTDQVFGRLEYRYTDYGAATYATGRPGGVELDNNHHRVTVGLGVKF